MPKVELHVHIEGSIRPETVLKLAERNKKSLPANTVQGLRDWYDFRDFEHFVQVYVAVTKCIQSAEDIELLVREFLVGQHEQNVAHTEATFTASTLEKHCGIPFDEQIDAVNRARHWAEATLGVTLGLILDIVRGDPVERGFDVLGWVKQAYGNGVVALGLAGIERLGTKEYAPVFEAARQEGIAVICHAGETSGPETIWDVLDIASSKRIGHGVRCMEDPVLVDRLVAEQVPVEVCPTSNICIGVFPNFGSHPIRSMFDAGLNVTLNSDDPPMFGTSLTMEWIKAVETFSFSRSEVYKMTMNAVEASLVQDDRRQQLGELVRTSFSSSEIEKETLQGAGPVSPS